MVKEVIALLVFGLFVQVALGAIQLESYNVDPTSVTVSGLSSGGAMSQQFHVAFSEMVNASGVFAGLPYACAKGGLVSATMCMSSPGSTVVNNLIKEIDTQASNGKIDSTNNLSGSKVYIFHGTKDTTVNQQNGKQVQQIYEHYGAVAKTDYEFAAVHGFPTDFYGAACGSSSAMTQYINNCNYHGAYEMLNYFYGNLVRPAKSMRLEAIETFAQAEFINALTPGSASMDAEGYVYIPSGCKDKTKKCKVHVAFHGCQQYKASIGNAFATKTGFMEVGEANNIIVLFPQATSSIMGGNPNGCWDWWGYLNKNTFYTKEGTQMKAVKSMIDRVAFCDGATPCYEDGQTTTDGPPTQSTEPPHTTPTRPPESTPTPGKCIPNEVSFHPFPGKCDFYTMCACGAEILMHCAPGLYFDPSINNCNFIQLVDCVDGRWF